MYSQSIMPQVFHRILASYSDLQTPGGNHDGCLPALSSGAQQRGERRDERRV